MDISATTKGTYLASMAAAWTGPNLWCDDLYNNDPAVLALASKATAYVTFQLANYAFAAGK